MYNIDLTFLGSAKSNIDVEEFERKQNNIYKKILVNDICPNFHSETECSECNKHPHTYADLDKRNIIEINCDGLLGSSFCEIAVDHNLPLEKDDMVLITDDTATEIAFVDEVGDIVKLRRQRLDLLNETVPKVIRKVTESDLLKYQTNLEDEAKAGPIFREKVEKHKLNMKLVSVHYQFDRKRLLFYYTADGRVDFRELAKELAGIFKTRIELRQIGVRDEAKKVGGIGSCGREYCCTSFLPNFKRITTQIASDQNITTNLSKLSGPCGKLKCCLSYELEDDE